MQRSVLALASLTVLLQAAAETTSGLNCFGASFNTVEREFDYQASLAASSCDLSRTRVTRLYILGACSKDHKNNFGGLPPQCPPGDWNIYSTSAATCEGVFKSAKPQDIKQPIGSRVFDAGQICNDGYVGESALNWCAALVCKQHCLVWLQGDTLLGECQPPPQTKPYSLLGAGVIFVETDCSNLTASSVQLQQRSGGSDFCWGGHTLARKTLAGIIVAGIVGTILLFAVPLGLYTLYWRRRHSRLIFREQRDAESNSKAACQVVKVSDSAFISRPLSECATEKLVECTSAYDEEYDEEADVSPQTAIPLRQLSQQ